MAIIKCSECGNGISSKATVCPNCGCPVEVMIKKQNSKKKKVIIVSIFVMFIFAILCICYLQGKIEILDYSNDFLIRDDLDWEEDIAYNMLFGKKGSKLLSYKEEKVFMEYPGHLEYRCYETDKNDLKAHEIFYIGWAPDIESHSKEIITQANVDKMVKAYDKRYGEHSVEELAYEEGKIYIWNLSNTNLRFDITVYKDLTYFNLRWVKSNHS